MYQTFFQPDQVNVNEIETLTSWLSKKTGQPIRVESLIVVSTDSVEISNMLDSLRDSFKNGHAPAASSWPWPTAWASIGGWPARGMVPMSSSSAG